MVVVVILGILAVLIVPRVLGRSDEARAAAAKHDIATLMQSLKLYRLDNGRYPSNDQGLQALVTKPQSSPVPPNWKPYLDKLPKDPWGNAYQYLNPGVRGEIDVFSFGADGQAGGTGADLAGYRFRGDALREELARERRWAVEVKRVETRRLLFAREPLREPVIVEIATEDHRMRLALDALGNPGPADCEDPRCVASR